MKPCSSNSHSAGTIPPVYAKIPRKPQKSSRSANPKNKPICCPPHSLQCVKTVGALAVSRVKSSVTLPLRQACYRCPACCGFGIAACYAKERVRTLAGTCYGSGGQNNRLATRSQARVHLPQRTASATSPLVTTSPKASALFNTSHTLHLRGHQPVRQSPTFSSL